MKSHGAKLSRGPRCEIANERHGIIVSLHIAPDHIHLFLSAHPKHAPSEIVRTIKSITAREMWEQHERLLEQMFWGGGYWECRHGITYKSFTSWGYADKFFISSI